MARRCKGKGAPFPTFAAEIDPKIGKKNILPPPDANAGLPGSGIIIIEAG
jgi:hypothetical protein